MRDKAFDLFWLKETMNRFLYLHILCEIILHYAECKMPLNCQFQPDKYPKQTSIQVRTWLTVKKIDLMIWPSQSLGLISIENLWRILKEMIWNVKSTTRENLWENIHRAWYYIPKATNASLVEPKLRKCKAVLLKKKAISHNTSILN